MSRSFPAKEVRSLFLKYFIKEHNHVNVPSSSVIPHDANLLFTNAGMNQFKPILQGREKIRWSRVANTQKCIRAGGKHNDLEDVGEDVYHHTFFEMLGNWSFDDYFKQEICHWAWEFLTKKLHIPSDRLYVTYFGGDGTLPPDIECRDIWRSIGVLSERILPFGPTDNFWEMDKWGPCGPCSEIHYDRIGGGRDAAPLINTGDSSVVELWNIVFMEFDRNADGLQPLRQRHIDCGLGLERLVSVVQNVDSNYETDLFQPLFDAVQRTTGAPPYGGRVGATDEGRVDTAYRLIADHVRALVVALSDGVRPANTYRGHVLRMILRRAVNAASDRLGASSGYIATLVPIVVESLGDTFSELRRDPQSVAAVINTEERRFRQTLERGRVVFERSLGDANVVSGDLAWQLYGTYGVPLDVTAMMASARGIAVDMTRFDELRQQASKLNNVFQRAKALK